MKTLVPFVSFRRFLASLCAKIIWLACPEIKTLQGRLLVREWFFMNIILVD